MVKTLLINTLRESDIFGTFGNVKRELLIIDISLGIELYSYGHTPNNI